MGQLSVLVFLACLYLPFGIIMLWLKLNYKTTWQKIKSTFLYIFISLPIVFLTLGGQEKFKKYQLEKYKTLTAGIVTNTYAKHSNRGGTISYWADVKYKFKTQIKWEAFCLNKEGEYKTGDSVIVIYSSDEPKFYSLGGKK